MAENDITRESLEEIIEYESVPQAYRDSAQEILTLAEESYDGNVDQAVTALQAGESTPAMEAVLNGEVGVTTRPLIDLDVFKEAVSQMDPEDIPTRTPEEDAQVRASMEEAIEMASQMEGVPIGATYTMERMIAYADAEHNGSITAAMKEVASMEPEAAYEALGMGNASEVIAQYPPIDGEPGMAPPEAAPDAAPPVAPEGAQAIPTSAPAAAAGATEAAAPTQNESAESMRRLVDMFNDGSFARAFESGDFGQILETLMAALTGQPFSMSNNPSAFAGVTTPNGAEVPTGTQVDPNSGQPVVAEVDAPAVVAPAEPRNAAAAPV